MSFDKTYSDDRGSISVRYTGLDLKVGVDSPLIQLMSRFGIGSNGKYSSLEDVTLPQIMELDLFRRMHIIDCSSDNPDNYLVKFYGADARLEGGRRFQGNRFGEAEWSVLRNYVAAEYSRVKALGRCDTAHVRYRFEDHSVSYRRLFVPLSSDGREVDHLLMGFLHDHAPVGE